MSSRTAQKADISAVTYTTTNEEKEQSTEVHTPLNVQRAHLMRSMSNEELVHKLRQCYPRLQEMREEIN